MPLLNFKKQFAPLVEAGIKRQTIRSPRKDCRNPHRGEILYLYTGLRTKSARKLLVVECRGSIPIAITENNDVVLGMRELGYLEATKLAKADGFDSFEDFLVFFRQNHGLPFFGFLIYW